MATCSCASWAALRDVRSMVGAATKAVVLLDPTLLDPTVLLLAPVAGAAAFAFPFPLRPVVFTAAGAAVVGV